MLPKVREALSKKILGRMEKEGLNWTTIQTANIKEEWNCPNGWSTLWKVVRVQKYSMILVKLERLLKYFEIPFNENYGIITLVDEQDYEHKTVQNEE